MSIWTGRGMWMAQNKGAEPLAVDLVGKESRDSRIARAKYLLRTTELTLTTIGAMTSLSYETIQKIERGETP